jgi:hypothetical protein
MRAAIFFSLVVTAALLSGCHPMEPQQINAFMGMPPDLACDLNPIARSSDSKPADTQAPAPDKGK